MYKLIVIIFLIMNLLFSFYFKSKVHNRDKSIKRIIIRNVVYLVVLEVAAIICCLIISNKDFDIQKIVSISDKTGFPSYLSLYSLFLTSAYLAIIHLVLDLLEKIVYIKGLFKINSNNRFLNNSIFIIKEVGIVLSLLCLVKWTDVQGILYSGLVYFDVKIEVGILITLLLLKPSSMLIEAVIGKPSKDSEDTLLDENNASSSAFLSKSEILGYVERLIMIILLFVKVYWAIPIVIVMKLGLRFHKLKDERQTEYLLIGSLISVLEVLVVYSLYYIIF